MFRVTVTRFSGLISVDFLTAFFVIFLGTFPFEPSANAESVLPILARPLACIRTFRNRGRQTMRHALNVSVAILAAYRGHLFVGIEVAVVNVTALAQDVVAEIRIVQDRGFHYLETHRLDVHLADLSGVLIFPNLKLLPKCDLALQLPLLFFAELGQQFHESIYVKMDGTVLRISRQRPAKELTCLDARSFFAC